MRKRLFFLSVIFVIVGAIFVSLSFAFAEKNTSFIFKFDNQSVYNISISLSKSDIAIKKSDNGTTYAVISSPSGKIINVSSDSSQIKITDQFKNFDLSGGAKEFAYNGIGGIIKSLFSDKRTSVTLYVAENAKITHLHTSIKSSSLFIDTQISSLDITAKKSELSLINVGAENTICSLLSSVMRLNDKISQSDFYILSNDAVTINDKLFKEFGSPSAKHKMTVNSKKTEIYVSIAS